MPGHLINVWSDQTSVSLFGQVWLVKFDLKRLESNSERQQTRKTKYWVEKSWWKNDPGLELGPLVSEPDAQPLNQDCSCRTFLDPGNVLQCWRFWRFDNFDVFDVLMSLTFLTFWWVWRFWRFDEFDVFDALMSLTLFMFWPPRGGCRGVGTTTEIYADLSFIDEPGKLNWTTELHTMLCRKQVV